MLRPIESNWLCTNVSSSWKKGLLNVLSVCRYYESLYDTSEYLNVSYPPNLSPDEQLEYETAAAKVPLPKSEVQLDQYNHCACWNGGCMPNQALSLSSSLWLKWLLW